MHPRGFNPSEFIDSVAEICLSNQPHTHLTENLYETHRYLKKIHYQELVQWLIADALVNVAKVVVQLSLGPFICQDQIELLH
jgi:hypothetical protein